MIAIAFKFVLVIVYPFIKGALSGLRQYLANKRPLKIMKKAFFISP